MKKNVSMQIKLMLSQKSLHYTLIVLSLFSCVAFLVNCISNFGRPITDVPNAYFFFIGSSLSEGFYYIFSIILPIICVIPFADSYFRDRNKNTLPIIILRSSPVKYYFSKGIAIFISGFIIVFISLALNFLLNFIAFPVSKGCDFTMFPTYYSDFYIKGYWSDNILLKNLFVGYPYLYNLLFLFIISIVGGVYSIIVYNLSYFTKKQHIMMLASMFVLSNVFAIISTVTNNFNIRLENYCFAFSQFESIDPTNIIIMTVLYLLMIFVPIPFCFKKLRDVIW